MLLGGICQAQVTMDFEIALKSSEVIRSIKFQNDITLGINRQLFDLLKYKITKLEKKVSRLEKEAQDSIILNDDLVIPPHWTLGKEPDYITLQDLLDYQKECYNDSILVDAYIERVDNGTLAYITRKVPSHYIHTEPTFEGFIEFMKKKYKVK